MAIRGKLKEKKAVLTRWVWKEPPSNEKAWEAFIRKAIRIAVVTHRGFKEDAISIRAAALTYALILSMVPMLALGTAVLKGLGAGNQIRKAAYQFINKLESVEKKGGKTTPTSPRETLSEHLRTAVDKVLDYVDKTNFAALGVFGIIGLILAVVSIFSKVEDAMNRIWKVKKGRTVGRKLMDYISLTVLFPLAINIGFGAQAALNSPKLLSYAHKAVPIPLFWTLVFGLFPPLVIVATFTIFYRFLPNTKVDFKDALAGGVVGSIGWIFIQMLYIRLQIGVARYNAIYGSFATIPLFLLWIYIGWMFFLVGAEVAYAAKVWKTYLPGEGSRTPRAMLAVAYDAVLCIYREFYRRKVPTIEGISKELGKPEDEIQVAMENLEKDGLIKRVGQGDEILPGAPSEVMNAWAIAEAILGKNSPPTKGGRLVDLGLKAARDVLKGIRIKDILKDKDQD